MALPTVQEKVEEKTEVETEVENHKAAEALFAVQEAQRLDAKRREEDAAEAEVKRVEEGIRKAKEQREAEEAREREMQERARRAEEEARRAEEARKAEEVRHQREVEMEDARRDRLRDILAALPKTLSHVLHPDSSFSYEDVGALRYLIEHFMPLRVVREDGDGPWVLNAQVAPLLGGRGLELLLPRSSKLDFKMSFSGSWATHSDFSTSEQANVQCAIFALAERSDGRSDSVILGEDIEMEETWEAELERTAQRLNAVNAAKAKFGDGGAVPLYCVRLADILAHLDPLLETSSIDVRFLTTTKRSMTVAATLDKQGIRGFVQRLGAFMSETRVFQRYRHGQVDPGTGSSVGLTDVTIRHEK